MRDILRPTAAHARTSAEGHACALCCMAMQVAGLKLQSAIYSRHRLADTCWSCFSQLLSPPTHVEAAAQALTLLTAMTEAGGEVAPNCGIARGRCATNGGEVVAQRLEEGAAARTAAPPAESAPSTPRGGVAGADGAARRPGQPARAGSVRLRDAIVWGCARPC